MALTHSIHCVMYGCESDISFCQDSGGFLCGVHNKSATLSFDQHISNGIVQSITFSECNSYIMRYTILSNDLTNILKIMKQCEVRSLDFYQTLAMFQILYTHSYSESKFRFSIVLLSWILFFFAKLFHVV